MLGNDEIPAVDGKLLEDRPAKSWAITLITILGQLFVSLLILPTSVFYSSAKTTGSACGVAGGSATN